VIRCRRETTLYMRMPMPAQKKRPPRRPVVKEPNSTPPQDVDAVVVLLKRSGTKAVCDGMARYGIPSDKAFGVSVGELQKLAKRIGRRHDLAAALWATGWYEARMLAAFVDDPAAVTPAQMDRWCEDFDNWAVCDTVCFHLFDRTPQAWRKVAQWAGRREEFIKRAAFALLWGLTVHDKAAGDGPFIEGLALVERAAADDRNFVKKAVNMALRATGKRNAGLCAAALVTAKRLAESGDPSARWVGRDAMRELTRVAAKGGLAAADC
jgi:3-methyladenine DNA glycosylase AlkD